VGSNPHSHCGNGEFRGDRKAARQARVVRVVRPGGLFDAGSEGPGHVKRLAAIAWFVVGPWAAARADDALPPSVSAAASAPSFRHDVMAVFSKAGCNLGTCHGNKNGKGGFKLSLRGDDPAADYLALTREFGSRRVSAVEPADSLLLRRVRQRRAQRSRAVINDRGARFVGLHRILAATGFDFRPSLFTAMIW